MIAISMDDLEKQKKFKESLKAPFSFVSDPEAKIINLYDVKAPLLSVAQRYTFVVGEDRKVLKIESGSDALNPEGAIQACPVRRPRKASAATEPGSATTTSGAPASTTPAPVK